MHFRAHAIIILFIILTVFGVWQWLQKPEPVSASVAQADSDYFVRILRASYGLNCSRKVMRLPEQPDVMWTVKPDNALTELSARCNGQTVCAVTPSVDFAMEDPAVGCMKMLDVEYRCFSYDRTWRKTARQGEILTIDCSERK